MESKHTKDEKLILKIRKGDQALIKELYHHYWGQFCSFFLKRKNLSKEEVKEIYTKSFTTFYFNIKEEKLNPPLQSTLIVYLIGIGKNYMLKYFDQKSRNKEHSVDEMESVQTGFSNPAVDDFYANQERGALVKKLLNQLGIACRELLQLSFIEENADDAIAIKLNIASEGAVRQKRFQCLKKLRKLIR